MTQTPLQEQEAAGTMAAGAAVEELDPTAEVVRESPAPEGEDRSWREPAELEASRDGSAGRPSLRARMARAPLMAAGVLAGGALLTGAGVMLAARAVRRARPHGPLAMARDRRR